MKALQQKHSGIMKQGVLYLALGLFLLLFVWGRQTLERVYVPASPLALPQRIVSLAPSVTETLYALDLGTQVVGVTQFCAYPPEVAQKPRVAGFNDINLEAVVRLRPDLVVLPYDKVHNTEDLTRLGLPVLPLDTLSLSGFIQAVDVLGQTTGKVEKTAQLQSILQQALEAAQSRALGRTPPRVLISVMHSYEGLGYIHQINAVGNDGFYSELIKAAGGCNVYQGRLPFPRLSREALIFLNPDVIIDILPPHENVEAVRRDWESLHTVSAIKNKRLFLFTDEADSIPGPRSLYTLKKLSHAFYPSSAPLALQ